MKVPTS